MNLFRTICVRYGGVHPDHHDIARGMGYLIIFVFLAKLAGTAKEIAIADRYGVSAEVDAYLYVINLLSWPVGVWFGVLTIVLVPLVAQIKQDTAVDLSRFRSELLGLTLLVGAGLLLFAWIGLPFLLQLTWTGMPPSTAKIAVQLVSTLSIFAPLGVLISFFSAWMMASGRQVNTLLEGLPSLVLLVVLIILPSGGVNLLVTGTVLGIACHLIILTLTLASRGEIGAPSFAFKSNQWPIVWRSFGVLLAGQAVMSFVSVIDQIFSASLTVGSISTLNYANRILGLPLGIGATVVSRATLQIFSRNQGKDNNIRHLKSVTKSWMAFMFASGIFAMFICWWLAPWVIRLLFERGAFIAKDTQAVAEVLRYGVVQFPFYFAGLVLVSALASQRRYKMIAIGASANLIVKLIANFIFVPYMGINGLMLGTAAMYIFSCLLLYWFENSQ